MNVTTNSNLAKIAIEKSLLKEYNTQKSSRTVYLNNGEEFQIQLFNPYDYNIAAKIYINNDAMTNMLVIKPGQRIWLERYLDNPRKFKFSTYEVEDSPEANYATRNNGEVRIEFYREVRRREYSPIYINATPRYYDFGSQILGSCAEVNCYSAQMSTVDTLGFAPSSTTTASTDSISYSTSTSLGGVSRGMAKKISKGFATEDRFEAKPETRETGRIEQGNHSGQELNNIDMDFESWSFRTETILLLPTSNKPVSDSDLKKIYCCECGRKLQKKYKFCPYCGAKID